MKKKLLMITAIACLGLVACEKEECPELEVVEPVEEIKSPSSVQITSFKLTNFELTNSDGVDWDGGTTPDPFIKFYIGNSLIYQSDVQGNATVGVIYELNEADFGILPINLPEGEMATLVLEENDPDGVTQEMTRMGLQTNFFYNSDNASQFTDLEFFGANNITIEISGEFLYDE